MTSCLIGKIVEISKSTILVEDTESGIRHTVTPINDEILDYKVGSIGLFVGYQDSQIFRATRINIRKFLDPLYEDEILETGSKVTFVTPLHNIFPELFKKYSEMQEKEDLENNKENNKEDNIDE